MVDGERLDCEDPDAGRDEMLVADAATTTEGDEYVNPLIVESSVGEETRIEEAIDDVLVEMLEDVELVVSAAMSAATTEGSLLAATLDTDDDAANASVATVPTLDEAKGYAGTVRSLGNAGTDGTDGRETRVTAGTDDTEDSAVTVGTVGSADTDSTGACDDSIGVESSVDRVSDGRDAIE